MTRSHLVPFKPGESGSARHERRLDANVRHAGEVMEWCHLNGIAFKVTNRGHHWTFRKGNQVAEWWPSSARLVYDRKYTRSLHLHDHIQVMRSLKKWFLGRTQ